MKQVHVVCAVICEGDCILACQRGYGEYKDGWEFPGGKVEANETGEEAVVREIREELNVEIVVDAYVDTVEMSYETFDLKMDCYLAHVTKGEIALLEHENMRWLSVDHMHDVNWLKADLALLERVKACMKR